MSIGLITAAALIPAKPVPRPAPIPAKNVTKIVINSGFNHPEIHFVERVKLPILKAVLKRIKILLNIPLTFKANCFSNIVLVANFLK